GRFPYAQCGTPRCSLFFDLLMEGRRAWCQRAALLSVVLARKVVQRNGNPNPVHVFDSGLAFENLALQGTAMGLVVHGMQGFDFDKARKTLSAPDDYTVSAMFAVGHPGNPAELAPAWRQREAPPPRKPVREFTSHGPLRL